MKLIVSSFGDVLLPQDLNDFRSLKKLSICLLSENCTKPLPVEPELPVWLVAWLCAHAFKKVYKRMNEQEQNTSFGIVKHRPEQSGNVAVGSERISWCK